MDVGPQHGWYDRGVIRQERSAARVDRRLRGAGSGDRRPRPLITTACGVAVLSLAGCGAMASESRVVVGPPHDPVGTTPATAAPGAAVAPAQGATGAPAAAPAAPAGPAAPAVPAGSTLLPIYFVRDGRLGVARRALPADAKIVDSALAALLQGPTEAEAAAGLSTAVPSLTRVRSTALMGDVLVVDVSGSFSALGPPGSSELRLAQIVYTVSVFPVRVLFHIDGQPARAVGGYVLPDRPVTRDDFAAWAPPVLVESVGPEDVLTNGTEISGSTAVADTGVGVRISDAAGQVLFEGSTRSTRDDGLRHPFRAAAPFLLSRPGPGTLTVWELEPAPGTTPLVLTIPVQLA
jgi:hypothetical protein